MLDVVVTAIKGSFSSSLHTILCPTYYDYSLTNGYACSESFHVYSDFPFLLKKKRVCSFLPFSNSSKHSLSTLVLYHLILNSSNPALSANTFISSKNHQWPLGHIKTLKPTSPHAFYSFWQHFPFSSLATRTTELSFSLPAWGRLNHGLTPSFSCAVLLPSPQQWPYGRCNKSVYSLYLDLSFMWLHLKMRCESLPCSGVQCACTVGISLLRPALGHERSMHHWFKRRKKKRGTKETQEGLRRNSPDTADSK